VSDGSDLYRVPKIDWMLVTLCAIAIVACGISLAAVAALALGAFL
jgi:hypothetical protein